MRESRFVIISLVLHGILFGSMLVDWKWNTKQEYMDSDVLLMGPKTGDKINPTPKKEKSKTVKVAAPVDENAPKVYDKDAGDPAEASEGTFGQGGTKQLDYDTELTAWIGANKRYPKLAKRLGQECDNIVVAFKVQPNGNLTDVTLVEKCQYEILNQAAIDQVKAASPFKPFPAHFPQTALSKTQPIGYSLSE